MSGETISQATVRQRPQAPSSISEEAQAYLSLPNPLGGDALQYPPLDDLEAWEQIVSQGDVALAQMFAHLMPGPDVLDRRELEIAGVRTFLLRPAALPETDDEPIVIQIHGGALFQGGGDAAWMMAAPTALERAATTWVPDYRMPPRHPYPAALDDCLNVYKAALEARGPERVIVAGASAGGNLAAATVLRARDEGLPVPAALVLQTPELDLTESGDTFRTNLGVDFLGLLEVPNLLYAGGADLADPYLSPLFGDVTGFPPTFLQAGTRDLFLSNAARMHRKLLAAGVRAELHVYEAMPHGGFGGNTPEDAELRATMLSFEREALEAALE